MSAHLLRPLRSCCASGIRSAQKQPTSRLVQPRWTKSRHLSSSSVRLSIRNTLPKRPKQYWIPLTVTAAAAAAATAVYYQYRGTGLDVEEDNDLLDDGLLDDSLPEESVSSVSIEGLIPYAEVQKHASEDDCWVVIKGMVYDLTEFLEAHPGGVKAILSAAGTDASETFSKLHPPNALEMLPEEACLGPVDPATMPEVDHQALTEDEQRKQSMRETMPSAENMLLLQDFENWAEHVLSDMAWSYYRSAADEEKTFHENRNAFQRYFLRPRVLRDTSHGDVETTFMGLNSTMPVFISPAAMAKLGHPLGEVNLTKAAGDCGIVQAISANASCSVEELFDAKADAQDLMFQIYLNKDRAASEALLQKVEKLGAKAIIFTVDVSWESKRTMDVRQKSVDAVKNVTTTDAKSPKSSNPAPLSVSKAISGYQDNNLTWNDIPFIRRNTKLPIIVKGVQCIEDVELCVKNGVEGVILSNHGGRQADYAPAPIDILYELRVLRPDLFDKIEIMIDGGIRSGADVVKAIALGAKAVGIGRPFLYANGTHGQEGVRRVCEILHEEITNTMRNIGVTKIEQLKPEMVGPAGPWVGWNRPSYVSQPQVLPMQIESAVATAAMA